MITPTTHQHLGLALLTIAAIAALPIQASAANCYTVRDSAGNLLEQTASPPVDMSRNLSDTVPEKYGPGSSLIFWPSDRSSCPDTLAVAQATPSSPSVDQNNFGRYRASNTTNTATATANVATSNAATTSDNTTSDNTIQGRSRHHSSGGGKGGRGGRRR